MRRLLFLLIVASSPGDLWADKSELSTPCKLAFVNQYLDGVVKRQLGPKYSLEVTEAHVEAGAIVEVNARFTYRKKKKILGTVLAHATKGEQNTVSLHIKGHAVGDEVMTPTQIESYYRRLLLFVSNINDAPFYDIRLIDRDVTTEAVHLRLDMRPDDSNEEASVGWLRLDLSMTVEASFIELRGDLDGKGGHVAAVHDSLLQALSSLQTRRKPRKEDLHPILSVVEGVLEVIFGDLWI